MRCALPASVILALAGCAPAAAPGSCDEGAWVAPGDPLAIPIEATGVAAWRAGEASAPVSLTGTLTSADPEGGATVVRVATDAGELAVTIGLPRERLGVLPIGEAIEVRLGDGVTILDGEGRIRGAIVSQRGREEAVAGDVTFRQAYAECVSTADRGTCARAMASPLVDVISGASVVRLPPGGVWRIPDDEDPSTEIAIVRSVRAPAEGELPPGAICDEAPARELAVIVRRLR